MSAPTDTVGVVRARFDLEEPQKWPAASWGYCSPLFRFPVNRAQVIDFEFDRQVFRIDSESGPVDIFDAGERTRVTMKCGLTLRGRSSTFSFRQFLQKARGRAIRFWMPDLMTDIYPVGPDLGGAYFDALDTGFSARMTFPQDARRVVGFYFLDGRPAVYRTITSASKVGQYDRFVLDRVLPPFAVSDLARVGFVMPVRFDQDTFELQHLTDDSAVVRTSVVMRSSEAEGLPDIECFTTSRPYPVDALDALDVTAGFAGGDLRELRYAPEGMDVTYTFSFGELRLPVVSYSMTAEGLNSTAAFAAGQLRPGLISYAHYVPEGLNSSAAIIAGLLRVGLISYANYVPEGLNSSAAFSGGTLT